MFEMSSVKVNRYTVKSSSHPLITKIYDTPKKWLGNDKLTQKRDIVILHKKTDHTYENIEYKDKLDIVQKQEDNVTLVNVEFDKAHCDKLRIVIDNFDKILDEYSKSDDVPNATSTPIKTEKKQVEIKPTSSITSTVKKDTRIPKLVKAKTCSIIESKCILKKSISQPASDENTRINKADRLQNKTQSMSNINQHSTTNDDYFKNVAKKASTNIDNDSKQSLAKSNNVKEIVKRLNSLTETTPTNNKDDTVSQTMAKAKSTMDLSTNKKISMCSRIPVNTSLRKSYPSIPCDLHRLDSDRSSAVTKKPSNLNKKMAKSAQNLTQTTPSKLSLHRADKSLVRSTQNLNQPSAKLSLPRSDKNLGRSVQNLNNLHTTKTLTKSVQHINKLHEKTTMKLAKPLQKSAPTQKRNFVKTELKPTSNLKLVKDLARNFDHTKNPTKYEQGTYKVNKTKTTADVVDNPLKLNQICTKKPTRPTQIDNAAVSKPSKEERIKSVIQKLEEAEAEKPCGKPKLIKTNTFKVKYPNSEAKALDKSNVINHGTFKKSKPDTVKLSLKRTQDFLDKLTLKPNEQNKFFIDPKDFVNDNVGKVINYLQEDGKVKQVEKISDKAVKKDLDYNSDNSDDSGNISNEIELDGDDSHSSTSLKSSESLTTVLDASFVEKDSGIDLSKSDLTTENKIFFRNGVLGQLEGRRDERLVGVAIRLQARCRGYLARRRLAHRRLQEVAVRCIQRNVRKFMAVRDWPWWRLLVRVTPLLDVHRTEEELRIKTEELEAMKLKLDRVETDRTKLKHENDKLEAKVGLFFYN